MKSLDDLLEIAEQKSGENELSQHLIYQISTNVDKYRRIARNQSAQEVKAPAWGALVAAYPEAKDVPRYDEAAFLNKLAKVWAYSDPQTGLMWVKNGNIAGNKMNWKDSTNWVNNLNYGGYSDWRLPTRDEFEAFVKKGGERPAMWFNSNGFNNAQPYFYWSSSPAFVIVSFYVWSVNLSVPSGKPTQYDKANRFLVWPVRDRYR